MDCNIAPAADDALDYLLLQQWNQANKYISWSEPFRFTLTLAVIRDGSSDSASDGSGTEPGADRGSGPIPTLIPLPSSAQISAPSMNLIWVVMANQALFLSTDEGKTWQSRGSAPGLFTASFINDQEGWALAPGSPETQCEGQDVQIMHTTDGGEHWHELSATGIGHAGCKSELSFTDASNGYVMASSPNSAPVVYRSSDGGKSWVTAPPLTNPPGLVQSPGGFTLGAGHIQAFGVQLLLVVGSGGRSYIYGSDDGGATWNYQATVPDVDGSVALVSATRWLIIVGPSNSFETTDAGKTWHPFTTDYSQAAPIPPVIIFGDESVGYATVRGEIQRTQDGGAHWVKIESPGTR